MLLRWTLLYAAAHKAFSFVNNTLVPHAVANVYSGSFLIIEGTFAQFAQSMDARPSCLALVTGMPRKPCTVVPAQDLIDCFLSQTPYRIFETSNLKLVVGAHNEDENHITREARNFHFPEGVPYGAVSIHDVDAPELANIPGALHSTFRYDLSPVQFAQVMHELCAWSTDADFYSMPSSSAGLYDPQQSTQLTSLNRFRFCVPVNDPSKVSILGRDFYNRTATAGFAYTEVSASGAMLDRSLVDETYYKSVGRLDFIGKPVLHDGLKRETPATHYVSRIAGNVADVTRFQMSPYAITKRDAFYKAQRKLDCYVEMATPRKRACADKRVHDYINKNKNVSAAQVEAFKKEVDRLYFGSDKDKYLPGNFVLHINQSSTITVAQLIERWSEFEGRGICDPLAPQDYNWQAKCWCYNYINHRTDLVEPSLFSFAHGSNQRYTFQLEAADDDRYSDRHTNEPYVGCIESFLESFLEADELVHLYDVQTYEFDGTGTTVRVAFDKDYWYFEGERLTISGDEVCRTKKRAKEIARLWRVAFMMYEGASIDHQDSIHAQYYQEDEAPDESIAKVLRSFNAGSRMALVAGTGSGKSATMTIEVAIPLALARFRAMAADEPFDHLPLPIILVPSESNLNTLNNYFTRYLAQEHPDLPDEVQNLIKDPTRRVRLMRKYKDLIPHQNNDDFISALKRAGIIFSTYAYLHRRSFLNLPYPLATLISSYKAAVVCDEIHQLVASCYFNAMLDVNFLELIAVRDGDDLDDDPSSSPSTDADKADVTTDDDEATGEAGYRTHCEQASRARRGHKFDPRVCEHCQPNKSVLFYKNTKGRGGDDCAHPLLPTLINNPINARDLSINRAPDFKYSVANRLQTHWVDIELLTDLRYESPFTVSAGAPAVTPITPMSTDHILTRPLPKIRRGNKAEINYSHELVQYLASLKDLQLQRFYPVAHDKRADGSVGRTRLSRTDLAGEPENGRDDRKYSLLNIGCDLRVLKGFDRFPLEVLAKAERLLVMSATISKGTRRELIAALPSMAFFACASVQPKLENVWVVDSPEGFDLERFVLDLDAWCNDTGVEVFVSRARKGMLMMHAKNIAQYKTLVLFISEYGQTVSTLQGKKHLLREYYARHPDMCGSNIPLPICFLDQGVYQPKSCAYIPSDLPIWQTHSAARTVDDVEAVIRDEMRQPYDDTNNQCFGRSLRLDQEPGNADHGCRLIFRLNIELIPHPTDPHGQPRYPDLHPDLVNTLNDRAKRWEHIQMPLGQRNKKQIRRVMDAFVADPTQPPVFELAGRNKRKVRLTPMEKKKTRIDEMVGAGLKGREIKQQLHLKPSRFTGKEALLAELIDYIASLTAD